ncbi:hypothetical protein G7Z17_g2122 [Cylindrodendrum hubeiense]|uniref:small monomeric GTPase n=1 Tax=Cylindrodendrum hubeiense TaxID=595255 RepID=A0A9P5HJH3_9HYPO|nr:hypothetical protein G7Z17_g2122 [Cylindrodendrum hubeiense]
MTHTSMTAEQNAAVREYLIEKKLSTVKMTVLGRFLSGRRKLLQRLTLGLPLELYDPSENGEHRMIVHVKTHPVILDFSMRLGNEWPVQDPWHHQIVQQGEGFLLVYDVTDRASFELLHGIHSELFGPTEEGKPLWVLATKTDQPQQKWVVSNQEGEEFSKSIGATFRSVSAHTGEGLGKVDAADMASWVILSKIPKPVETEGSSKAPGANTAQTRRFSLHSLRNKVNRLLHKETK